MSRFQEAFEQVLGHKVDRQILAFLKERGPELRYEALRRGVGVGSPQQFKYAMDRLSSSALVKRRLVERGERFASFISMTPAGASIARMLVSLHAKGELPRNLPVELRRAARAAFLAPLPAA